MDDIASIGVLPKLSTSYMIDKYLRYYTADSFSRQGGFLFMIDLPLLLCNTLNDLILWKVYFFRRVTGDRPC